MNVFRLFKATVEGDARPTWLLFSPGEHHRPLTIPHGNMVEIVTQFVEQGGALEPTTDGRYELVAVAGDRPQGGRPMTT